MPAPALAPAAVPAPVNIADALARFNDLWAQRKMLTGPPTNEEQSFY